MQRITHKEAMQIARDAIAAADRMPDRHRVGALHDEVNQALGQRGYGPVTVLAMDGLSINSVRGVASEIYNKALRERDPKAADARIERRMERRKARRKAAKRRSAYAAA